MAMCFVVERRTGPKCDPSQPLEGQSGWLEHAAFMDALVDDGVVVLCGPLANESRVVLVVEVASEDEARAILGRDPWSGTHLVLESAIRLDGRARSTSTDPSSKRFEIGVPFAVPLLVADPRRAAVALPSTGTVPKLLWMSSSDSCRILGWGWRPRSVVMAWWTSRTT